MILNKKGVSIVELIISVALISVVMLFMYRLIAQITYEKEDDTIDSLNQEQRVIIVNRVEKTIRQRTDIDSITVTGKTIAFKDNGTEVYNLSLNDNNELTLYDTSKNTTLDVWKIKGGTVGNPTCVNNEVTSEDILDNIILYKCTFNVYTTNKSNSSYNLSFTDKTGSRKSVSVDNNNTLDDLVFSFMLYKQNGESND